MHDAPPVATALSEPPTFRSAVPHRPRREIILEWLAGEPLVPAAIGLSIGIFLDAVWRVPFWSATVVFIVAGVAIWRARRTDAIRHAAIAVAALSLGAVLHESAFYRWPAHHVVRYCGERPTPARVRGTVIHTPQFAPLRTGRIAWMRQPPRTRLMVEVDQLEGVSGPLAVTGLVAVTVPEPVLGVAAGDRVELFGTLFRPGPVSNPGERNWALLHRRRGVLVQMTCRHAANVAILRSENWFAHGLAKMRRLACAAMREQAFDRDTPGARLLDALVLGQRSAVDEDLNQAFVNTGTIHYLSVSGAHVGVLLGAVWLIGWLLGRSRRQCALVAKVVVIVYALFLTEPSPAVTRAAIMSLVFCCTILCRRSLRSANGLALAALILLIAEPTQLFDPGFQLSFFTLMGIMYLSPLVHQAGKWAWDKLLRRDDPLLQPDIQHMLNPPSRLRQMLDRSLKLISWSLALSVAAWSVGAPLSAYHFGQVAPWGWLNTVVVTIPMSTVLLLGLLKTLLSLVFPQAGFLPGWPLEKLTGILIGMIHFLDGLPGSGMLAPAIPAWLAAAVLMTLALWALARPLHIRRRWVAFVTVACAGTAVWQVMPHRPAEELRLHLLDVGNGTACVIQMPGGRTIVYDAGSRPPYDMYRWTLGPFFAQARIRSVDALILTHPELDHFSSVPDLLDHVHVGELITAPHFQTPARSGSADRLIADLRTHELPWHTAVRGDRLDRLGATIEVLWPPPKEHLEIRDANDSSLVLRITYAGRRILLCGDIEEEAQRHLLLSPKIQADVLVLPHHGGVVSNTQAFIDAVNPAICLRSTGQRNRDTTNGLIALMAGRRYFSTADDGAIEVQITPEKFQVSAIRRPNREQRAE